MKFHCTEFQDAIEDIYNVIDYDGKKQKFYLRQADLFSINDEILFCPFCGEVLNDL